MKSRIVTKIIVSLWPIFVLLESFWPLPLLSWRKSGTSWVSIFPVPISRICSFMTMWSSSWSAARISIREVMGKQTRKSFWIAGCGNAKCRYSFSKPRLGPGRFRNSRWQKPFRKKESTRCMCIARAFRGRIEARNWSRSSNGWTMKDPIGTLSKVWEMWRLHSSRDYSNTSTGYW